MDESTLQGLREIVYVLDSEVDRHFNLTQLKVFLAVVEQEIKKEPAEIRLLTERLQLDRRTVSRAISLLGASGPKHRRGLNLVSVSVAPDRRARRVALTESGWRLAGALGAVLGKLGSSPQSTPALVLTDALGQIIWANESFVELCGYTLTEVRGKRPGDFLRGPRTERQEVSKMATAIANRSAARSTITNYDKCGRAYVVDIDLEPIVVGEGNLGFIACERLVEWL